MAMGADACSAEAAPRRLAHLLPLPADEPAFISCEDGKLVLTAGCSLAYGDSKVSSPCVPSVQEAAASARRSRARRSRLSVEESVDPRIAGCAVGESLAAPVATSVQAGGLPACEQQEASLVGQKPVDETSGLDVSVPALVRSAEHGDVAAVTSRLAAGEDPDSQDDFGMTALHSAARKGHFSIVVKLLEHGAKVNRPQYRGETALHYACKYGHTAVARILLAHGSDVQLHSHDGKTPKQLAEGKKRTDVLEVLAEFSQQAS